MSIKLRTIGRIGEFVTLGALNLLTRNIAAMVVVGALSEFVISPDLRSGIRVQGTLTMRVVQDLKKEDSSPRRASEVMFSVPQRNAKSVVVITI